MNEDYTAVARPGLEIAIVGMAGRFPGARDLDAFFELLRKGEEAIRHFSKAELEEEGVPRDLLDKPEYVRASAVLPGYDLFDAGFFGYSPAEAKVMSPQMRLMHECCWEALEHAGYDPDRYSGLAGLYAGGTPDPVWEALTLLDGKQDISDAYSTSLLHDKDLMSTRVAYRLNLQGPGLTVFTSCSTSLVAIHLACQALLGGECDLALAGGVSVMTPARKGYLYQEGMIVSSDGHVRAFDAAANGTVFGDGVGVVVLKRLEEALEEGDTVYAVIKGSAVNNDGNRKAGYSAPSVEGQAAVIRSAHQMAEVEPDSISYVETHGAGTTLGDPIEFEGLCKAFGHPEGHQVGLGSVKTNVGHLNSAAGVASLIKTVLSLRHRLLFPSLHFKTPNPNLRLAESPFYVVNDLRPWSVNGNAPRRAGVSAFGAGGTNAHLVLEEAPEQQHNTRPEQDALILLSARSPAELEAQAEQMLTFLKQQDPAEAGIADVGQREAPLPAFGPASRTSLHAIAWTLATGRREFPYRRMLVARDHQDLISLLDAGKGRTQRVAPGSREAIFMFSGLGGQYVNMGRGLYADWPLFRNIMDEVLDTAKRVLGRDIRSSLYPESDTGTLSDVQVVLFVFGYALARLMQRLGISPVAVMGYSFGEFTAACVAGVMSLEDGLRLVDLRGRLMDGAPRGLMLSVPLPESELRALLPDTLSLAVVNGDSCIVAGATDSVESFENQLQTRRIMSMRLSLGHAGHSLLMADMVQDFELALRRVELKRPSIPLFSTFTKSWLSETEATDPAYWAGQILETVRFVGSASMLAVDPNKVFIEVGPGQDLAILLKRETGENTSNRMVNLIRPAERELADSRHLLDQLGRMWLSGLSLDWEALYEGLNPQRTPLPTYPFQRTSYWIDDSKVSLEKGILGAVDSGLVKKEADVGNWFYLPSWKRNVAALLPGSDQKAIVRGGFDGTDVVGGNDPSGESNSAGGIDAVGGNNPSGESNSAEEIDAVGGNDSSDFNLPLPEAPAFFVPAVNPKASLPASWHQERLWFIDNFETGSLYPSHPVYHNTALILQISGDTGPEALMNAMLAVLERHAVFRTRMLTEQDRPMQVTDVAFPEPSTLRLLHAADLAEAVEVSREAIRTPFELEEALWRMSVVDYEEAIEGLQAGSKNVVLILVLHHLIADRATLNLLERELRFRLNAGGSWRAEDQGEAGFSYGHFSSWQHAFPEAYTEALMAWWRTYLPLPLPALHLPLDAPREAIHVFEAGESHFELKIDVGAIHPDIGTLAETEGQGNAGSGLELADSWESYPKAYKEALCFTVFILWLRQLSGQEEFMCGTSSSGRQAPVPDGIAGPLENLIPVWCKADRNKRFRELVRESRLELERIREYDRMPFDRLVAELQPEKDMSRTALFDVLFRFESAPTSMPEVQGIQLRRLEHNLGWGKYDLNLLVLDAPGASTSLRCHLVYNKLYLKAETIAGMVADFQGLWKQLLAEPDCSLDSLPVPFSNAYSGPGVQSASGAQPIPKAEASGIEQQAQPAPAARTVQQTQPAQTAPAASTVQQAQTAPAASTVQQAQQVQTAPAARTVQQAQPAEAYALIFEDEAGFAGKLKTALAAQGKACISVSADKGFKALENGDFLIHPGRETDYESLISALVARGMPAHILHCWGITNGAQSFQDAPAWPQGQETGRMNIARGQETDRMNIAKGLETGRMNIAKGQETDRMNIAKGQETGRMNIAKGQETDRMNIAKGQETGRMNIARELERGFYSLLYLSRGLERQGGGEKISLHFLTNGALEVSGEEVLFPAKTPVYAAAKVLAQEFLTLDCLCTDVSWPQASAAEEKRLFEQLQAILEEDHQGAMLALRGRFRWEPHWEASFWDPGEAQGGLLSKGGTYLITGGLGNIGLKLAAFLATQYQAKLVLLSRNDFPLEAEWEQQVAVLERDSLKRGRLEKLLALKRVGATPLVLQADVGDPVALSTALREAEARFGPLSGVIHAAGITGDRLFRSMSEISPEECEAHFQAKIYGLENLKAALAGKQLDFCLLISSLSNYLGGLGHVAYAAANLYMDLFVQRERQAGQLHWMVVNWETLKDEAAVQETALGATTAGLSMKSAELIETFEKVLSPGSEQHWLISSGDMAERAAQLSRLESASGLSNLQADLEPAKGEKPELLTPFVEPGNPTQEKLTGIWERLFGFGPIGIQDDFFDLGGDSLKAMVFLSQVHKQLQVQLPLASFFKAPSVEAVSEFIRQAGTSRYEAIPKATRREYWPLTAQQQRLYFLQQIDEDRIAYNEPQVVRLRGVVEPEKLAGIFKQLIERHSVLRTYIGLREGLPVQLVAADFDFQLELIEGEEATLESQIRTFIRPFALDKPLLIRAGLIRLGPAEHVLVIDRHHIITDAISNTLFIGEFLKFYAGESLPEPALEYVDYAVWQQEGAGQRLMREQEGWWLETFSGSLPLLDLPVDFPRPAIQSMAGENLKFRLGAEAATALKQLAAEEAVTLFVLLLALFHLFLSKLSGQEQIVISASISGRHHADTQGLAGMFVNTLALRNEAQAAQRFKDFLKAVNEHVLDAFAHQDYQVEELIDRLDIDRDLSRNPLFDVMFRLDNMDDPVLQAAGLEFELLSFEPPTSKFDLTLTGLEMESDLEFTLEYCTDLFKAETAATFVRYFQNLVRGVLAAPQLAIQDYSLLSEEEERALLQPSRERLARSETRQYQSVPALFEQVAQTYPGHTAISWPETLTYQELDAQADLIARALIASGAGNGQAVGILMDRSPAYICAILGILKAGGAWLPLDPEYPEERLAFMLSDSGAAHLIVDQDTQSGGQFSGVEQLVFEAMQSTVGFVDKEAADPEAAEAAPAGLDIPEKQGHAAPGTLKTRVKRSDSGRVIDPEQTAYIIYTSGTTGKPKGVCVSHANLLGLLADPALPFSFSEKDHWCLFHSPCFDFAVWEIFGALLFGGQLAIVSRSMARDPHAFAELVRKQGITVLNQTPGAFYALSEELLRLPDPLSALRYVVFGGDKLESKKLEAFNQAFPHVKLINMYGITEATIHVTYKELGALEISSNSASIGPPLPNAAVLVLDRNGKPQAPGLGGELYIGGNGIATGYLRRPGLNLSRFVSLPGLMPGRWYRSGDLGRFLPNGELEYLGRIDQQIQVRGFRIEPGEIEAVVRELPGVQEAVILASNGAGNTDSLLAYVTGPEQLNTADLRLQLQSKLPGYMIPSRMLQVEAIPMTANGKLDKKALLKMAVPEREAIQAPGNEQEQGLVKIWAETLGREADSISVEDNFFDLGGNSLNLIRIRNAVREAFGPMLPVALFFRHPTIRSLAAYLNQSPSQDSFQTQQEALLERVSKVQERRKSRRRKKPGQNGF